MSEFKQKYIQASKSAVDELIDVIKADIKFESANDSKKKTALKTKKKAIVSCKNIISGILEHDYHQQEWARKKINQIIDCSDSAIRSLLSGLEDEINIGEEGISDDADSISNAIDSKTIAFEDASEIIEVIDDLKRISSEDEIIMNNSEFAGGYAENFANKLTKVVNKSGYDEKNDYVIIDPEGTVGDIVEIEGIKIALPKQPAKKDILYHDKKTKDQYWKRQAPPKGLTPKTAKLFENFIDEEQNKRWKGTWFYNKGKAEYITGAHWELISHCLTEADGGYFFFSKAQQKLFWYLEAAWCDKRSYGVIIEKIRRFGMTHCCLAFIQNKTCLTTHKYCGMTSKTDKDAGGNFDKLTLMFSSLPFYLKPICLDEKSKSKLEFSTPARRLSKNNKGKEIIDDSLQSKIDFKATDIGSYDGNALHVYLADEFSKWKKQNGNTLAHWEIVKKCLTKGKNITGKAIIVSTIEHVTGRDAEDEDALAGDRYKWLYYNSDPTERDANGRTITGLYKLFISCLEHYEGFIDKYGYCISETPKSPVESITGDYITTGVSEFINNELAAIKGNARATLEYKRKTPIKEGDGFTTGEGSCAFNQAHIQEQMIYNNNLVNEPFRIGNFKWKNGVQDCNEVVWCDSPEGRFRITWLPEEDIQNNVKMIDGLLRPMNAEVGNFGVDPYRVNKTVDNKGSKGSMHGFAKYNSKGAPDNSFFLEYINRPDSKEIFYDDMIMAMVFYGMPALIENNVNNLIEEMYRRGYRKFSMQRPDKPKDKLSDDEKRYGGIPSSSENVIQMMSSNLETYIEYYVGDGGNMYFNRTLQDWLVYDEKNRTKRDASISSSLALIGANHKNKRNIISQNQEIHKKPILMSYNNKGVTSKIIAYNG